MTSGRFAATPVQFSERKRAKRGAVHQWQDSFARNSLKGQILELLAARGAENAVPENAVPENAVRFVALDKQHGHIETELMEVFARLLRTSAYTLGTEVEQFEAEFADYCETGYCVGVSSGTSALSLVLRSAGIGPGDEVIVPAHTFIASALGAAHAGATPVLCDVDAATGLIDPDAARAAITPRTAAIVAVHLYGQMCDMDAISEIANSHGLFVLEDAAQAHGALHKGHRAGSLGDAGAFSFYPSKNLGALGDGGAVCTGDQMLAARLRRLRNLGQRTKGEHVELGFNERLDGLQAALLRVKLPHLDDWNHARRARAQLYRELLLPADVRLLEERPESPCIYHLMPARFGNRDAMASALRARGIQTGIHYAPAMDAHPALEGVVTVGGEIPAAQAWAADELSLPMHPDLNADEVEQVAAAVIEAITAPASAGAARC